MANAAPAKANPARVERATRRLLRPLAYILRTGNPAATIDRLFTSRHVMDLQLIVASGFLVVLLFVAVGVPLSIENQLYNQWPASGTSLGPLFFLHIAFSAANSFLTFFVPVVGVFAAVLAWAYQTGSARLGVVDLFACEVSTLCRVAAVVDSVRLLVERFEHGPPPAPPDGSPRPAHAFTSQEDYFPVFGNNVKDLQTLEARVVINITAFYTYMKAVRDSQRALAELTPPSGPADRAAGAWHDAARNVVYMLFLGLESARRAVADLVEFEPEKAERTVVILISELVAYPFLCQQYPDEHEMHHERIMLRQAEYRDLVPRLCAEVEAGKAQATCEFPGLPGAPETASPWEPAWLLLHDLRERYQALTAEPPIAISQSAGA